MANTAGDAGGTATAGTSEKGRAAGFYPACGMLLTALLFAVSSGPLESAVLGCYGRQRKPSDTL